MDFNLFNIDSQTKNNIESIKTMLGQLYNI